MWSGIEDVYVMMTGEEVPNGFFFCMASSGETVYLKFKDEERPRMLSLGDGRTRSTYDRLKGMIGLEYKISEGKSYDYALKSVMKEIDHGRPVILGPIDMYYLPYLKMYHKDHIPMHYVLMAGYDLKNETIFLYDCDRTKMQKISFEQLKMAWNIEKNAVGDKNGFIRFSLHEPASVEKIAEYSLRRKAVEQLREKPEMLGISAFRKIAKDFPKWKKDLTVRGYENALRNLTEFFGTVPTLPNRLMGVEKEDQIRFQGGYDRYGEALIWLGEKYDHKDWCEAGQLFMDCGLYIEEVKKRIVSCLCDGEDTIEAIPSIFLEIAEIEEKAYKLIG